MKNPKREHLETCLDKYGYATIYFYNKYRGVDIPNYLKEENSATLIKISNGFAYTPTFTQDSFVMKLSFRGEYYECNIPYACIVFIGGSNDESLCKYYEIDFSTEKNIQSALLAEIEEDNDW